jgi:hypothetical protein
VIRWPLRLGHNFLYVASTLIEAVMFTQVGDVLAWHAAGAAYAVTIWLLFAIDMRMIQDWARDRTGSASQALTEVLSRDQLLNVRVLMPLTAAFYAVATWIIAARPLWFGPGLVLALGLVQLAWTIAYLAYVVMFLARLSPLILSARREGVTALEDRPAHAHGREPLERVLGAEDLGQVLELERQPLRQRQRRASLDDLFGEPERDRGLLLADAIHVLLQRGISLDPGLAREDLRHLRGLEEARQDPERLGCTEGGLGEVLGLPARASSRIVRSRSACGTRRSTTPTSRAISAFIDLPV